MKLKKKKNRLKRRKHEKRKRSIFKTPTVKATLSGRAHKGMIFASIQQVRGIIGTEGKYVDIMHFRGCET